MFLVGIVVAATHLVSYASEFYLASQIFTVDLCREKICFEHTCFRQVMQKVLAFILKEFLSHSPKMLPTLTIERTKRETSQWPDQFESDCTGIAK